MRYGILTLAAWASLACLALGQQQELTPEEEKFLVERAKKQLASDDPKAVGLGAFYLSDKKPEHRPLVVEAILKYKKTDKARYNAAFFSYRTSVPPKEVPAEMVPEYVGLIEKFKKDFIPDPIRVFQEMGPRAKAAVPLLEWIRDNNPDQQTALAARRALQAIQGKKKAP